ncbi:hypothetical protein T12_11135 [Trichinella patagoniensis]|uniref:Integrase catalytic domain-containing protein n=1 Tax=Trichinella patagoniensis TaxID=990121 RepID=A0A0V0Z9N3_9BILA|nr:hypothetical protein T12_11135 [Trichinella patagoniensis]
MLPPRQLCPLLSWTTKEVREQTRQDMAMSYIWWPRLDEDVELLAKTCTTCEINQADLERSLIWLVVIDAMTKWPEVVCFRNYPTAGMLVEALQAIFARFVYPEEIVTDNGSRG